MRVIKGGTRTWTQNNHPPALSRHHSATCMTSRTPDHAVKTRTPTQWKVESHGPFSRISLANNLIRFRPLLSIFIRINTILSGKMKLLVQAETLLKSDYDNCSNLVYGMSQKGYSSLVISVPTTSRFLRSKTGQYWKFVPSSSHNEARPSDGHCV